MKSVQVVRQNNFLGDNDLFKKMVYHQIKYENVETQSSMLYSKE